MYIEFLFTENFYGITIESPNYKTYIYSTQAILLAFAIYLFNQHFKTLRLYGFKFDSSAMLWSMVDLIPLLANLLSIIITIGKEL